MMNSLRLKKMAALVLSAVIIGATLLFTASSPIAPSPVQAQAAASSTELAYVTNKADKTISVIDTATQTVIDTIFIGRYVEFIVLTPDGKEAYVGAGDGTVSVVDTRSREVTHTIPIGTSYEIAVTPDGKEVYAVGNKAVFVIDTKTHEVSETISVGDTSCSIVITPDGKQAYVSIMGGVSVIDTKTHSVTHTISLEDDLCCYLPHAIAITPDGRQAYVDHEGSILVFDTVTKKLVKSIPTGKSVGVGEVVFTLDGKKAYVIKKHFKSDPRRYEVAVIDTKVRQVIRNIEMAGHPYKMDITSDGKQVYMTDVAKDLIMVMDIQTDIVSGTISVGDHPVQVVIAPSP
jgi:YVTN family beta-propeller protein